VDHLQVHFVREAHRVTRYLLTCVDCPVFPPLSCNSLHFSILFLYPILCLFLSSLKSLLHNSPQANILTCATRQHRILRAFPPLRTHNQHSNVFSNLPAMAATTKGKPEGLLGLSHNEARLILLGILYTDASGKVCYAHQLDD
jgi:hypothetical protein